MFRLRSTALLVALSAMLSGCWLFVYNYDYKMIKEETVIDPATGDLIRTFTWEYEDGKVKTTTDRIPKGEDNEQRRGERPLPPTRVARP